MALMNRESLSAVAPLGAVPAGVVERSSMEPGAAPASRPSHWRVEALDFAAIDPVYDGAPSDAYYWTDHANELRELVIAFGDSGYVALYRHEPADDAVYVLAFRHQKEAGY